MPPNLPFGKAATCTSLLVRRSEGDILEGTMIPEERALFDSMRREHQALQEHLAALTTRLAALETASLRRGDAVAPGDDPLLPPVPNLALHPLPPLPPAPALSPAPALGFDLPPLPLALTLPPVPRSQAAPPSGEPSAPPPARTGLSLEDRVGRGLILLGGLVALVALVSLAALLDLENRIGPLGRMGLLGGISLGLALLGDFLERRPAGALLLPRTLLATGLAGLFFTLYASETLPGLRVIHHAVIAIGLTILWALYVLSVAERKQSRWLGGLALLFAFASIALRPSGQTLLGADLVLALAAVVFFLRNGGTLLPYFALWALYLSDARYLFFNRVGELVLDTSRGLGFLPLGGYLIGAWLVFTAAVLFSHPSRLRGKLRQGLLTCNNAFFAFLLAAAAQLSGYGLDGIGRALLLAGALSLAAALILYERRERAKHDVAEAYLAQGLAVLTGGLMLVFTGTTRALVLAGETLLLGLAVGVRRSQVLAVSCQFIAFFATAFLIWEVAFHEHHPWLLGLGGAAILLIMATAARHLVSPVMMARCDEATGVYCSYALVLLAIALTTELTAALLPPALALSALALSATLPLGWLLELPLMAQGLLLLAQGLVLFPTPNGETIPWWTTGTVIVVTLLLLVWWSRQERIRLGPGLRLLTLLYSLAIVGLIFQALRPSLDAAGWLAAASLLALGFYIVGALLRVWSLAVAGQAFLAVALVHFFSSFFDLTKPFAYDAWTALLPIGTTYLLARLVEAWPVASPWWNQGRVSPALGLARGYRLLALLLAIAWISVALRRAEQPLALVVLAVAILLNSAPPTLFALASALVVDLAATVSLFLLPGGATLVTLANGLALLLFFGQPAILLRRFRAQRPFLPWAVWLVSLLAVASGWWFVTAWARWFGHDAFLTVAWALYAVFLFFISLAARQPVLRWCSLGILVAGLTRLLFFDFGGLSSVYRVVTFAVVATVLLLLGCLSVRRAHRQRIALV